ncbi:MAG: winged helix DNA-binding protein [Candidatus Thermoplasmatota archaeon]
MIKENFTSQQIELIDRIIKAGLERNVAKTLVFIASRGEVKSNEIENSAELEQPEVSHATQKLREKGWVGMRRSKKKGKENLFILIS